jgi:hypothetical protein
LTKAIEVIALENKELAGELKLLKKNEKMQVA